MKPRSPAASAPALPVPALQPGRPRFRWAGMQCPFSCTGLRAWPSLPSDGEEPKAWLPQDLLGGQVGITGHSDACCGQRSVANTDMWMQNRDIHLIPTTAEIPPEPCSKLTRPFPGRPPPQLVQSPVMHPRVMLECRSHSFVLLCECSVLPVVSCPLTLLMTLVLST